MNYNRNAVRCPHCHTKGVLCDMPALATIGKGFVAYVLHDSAFQRVCLLNKTEQDNLTGEPDAQQGS